MRFLRERRAITIAGILFCVSCVTVRLEASVWAGVGARECHSLFTSILPKTQPPRAYSKFGGQPNDSENGFVTNRLPITAENILEAYKFGVFPWETTASGNGAWFSPLKRGIMDLRFDIGKSDLKILRRLEAAVERGELRVSFDEAFEQVMRGCAGQLRMRRNPRTLEMELGASWITEQVIHGYSDLHRAGKAHSVEIWRGNELVGGMYGVLAHGVFTAESMFHKEPEVTKLALFRLGKHLRSRGFTWMDVQIAPPTTMKLSEAGELVAVPTSSLSVKWGAVEEKRDNFYQLLDEARIVDLTWGTPVP